MIETLITSSALIAGICLLRLFLKGRISPGIQYGIWATVALRLMIPWFSPLYSWFRTIESPFSVMNAADNLREMASVRPVAEPLLDNLGTGQVIPYAVPAAVAGRAAGHDWNLIILTLWILGGILLFARMMWTNLHFSWSLYMRRERYLGDTYGITKLPVYCVQGLSTPCFMAFLCDRAIYIPWDMAEDEGRLRHILIHEDCHASHHDHIWSMLRCILLCYYWIDPLVWAAAFLSKRDSELACDAAAVRRLGEGERIAYGRTLISLMEKRRHRAGVLNVSPDMWNGKRAVKERIAILAKHPVTTRVMACILVLILTVLVVCTYTGKQSQSDITARTEAWANAFCGREGNTLKDMFDPQDPDGFYKMDQVQSQPGDPAIGFGWSSPWPMDQLYETETEVSRSEITYYAMTSDPHRWVWKEHLTWKQEDGIWYVEQETLKEYDSILSAREFYEAYGRGIAGTPMDYRKDGMAEILNEHAASDPVLGDLRYPDLAMEYLLNLHGGKGTVVENLDTAAEDTGTAAEDMGTAAESKSKVVVYTFPDKSRAAVTMIQPFGGEGIWIPEELTEIPESALDKREDGESSPKEKAERAERTPEGALDGTLKGTEDGTDRISMDDVLRLAGVTDAASLAERTKNFPEPDRVDGDEDENSLNRVEHYPFVHLDEPYEIQVSYENRSGDLDYISLQRLTTGEWLNLYQTPEAVKKYGIKLADRGEIEVFFATHRKMSDYLTYRLPGELSDGDYMEALGNSSGGNLFLTSDQAAQRRLEDLNRYVDTSAVPQEWRSAGAVQRFTGDWLYRRFEQGELMEIGYPWNHSMFISEPVSVIDCEVPALLILVSHDMYTSASLTDAEAEHGPIPEEDRTSRMWYIFFAESDSDEMYAISLNGDLYHESDLLKIARTVHFTENAWTKK